MAKVLRRYFELSRTRTALAAELTSELLRPLLHA